MLELFYRARIQANGGGEAFAFDVRNQLMKVVMVPFIGMSLADAIPVADSFDGLLSAMANGKLLWPPDLRDGELWFITPIVLGGSPTASENVTFLTRAQHIEAVRYWNKYISELKGEPSAKL